MYQLYVVFGKNNVDAIHRGDWWDVDPAEIDVYEFWTQKEGLGYIKHLERTEKYYYILSKKEYNKFLERQTKQKIGGY